MSPPKPESRWERCERCRLRIDHCLCAEITPMHLETHLALVMHRREVGKPSNTGSLALQLFPNSSRYVRGVTHQPLDLSELNSPERRIWVLFPSDKVEVLTRTMVEEDPRPVTLIVPDGSWTQARRVVRREALLREARHVVPPSGAPTRYRLRQEHVEGGLATAEAIARALAVIEGPRAQAELEALFDLKVSRVLSERSHRRGPA